MKKIDAEILEAAKQFVTDKINRELPENILYHSLEHTQLVAESAKNIGQESGLDEYELIVVQLCAWFHDVGFVNSHTDHEIESIKIAAAFLSTYGVDSDEYGLVRDAILATRIPQEPQNKISQVLCDADMFHISHPDYLGYAEKLRLEYTSILKNKISKAEFKKSSLLFFTSHRYHTEYGKTVLQTGKNKNLAMLENNTENQINKKDKQTKELNKEIERLQKKLEKQKGYSRGVESMFRLTARNQINLSSIADNKSNILISVNTIIISIVITVLVSRFSEYPAIILPSLIFLTMSLITIIFAILSTRPNISSGTFSKEDINQKKVNLLFFGNFYNMSLDEYDWALGEMMKDDDYLYATMIKDQYSLGKVLARKYKLLRKAYNFFMFGMIISVLAFVLSFVNI